MYNVHLHSAFLLLHLYVISMACVCVQGVMRYKVIAGGLASAFFDVGLTSGQVSITNAAALQADRGLVYRVSNFVYCNVFVNFTL